MFIFVLISLALFISYFIFIPTVYRNSKKSQYNTIVLLLAYFLLFFPLVLVNFVMTPNGHRLNSEEDISYLVSSLLIGLFYAWQWSKDKKKDIPSEASHNISKIEDELLTAPVDHNDNSKIELLYQDYEGNITRREIILQNNQGQYLEGFCLKRNAHRMFKKERVLQYFGGSEQIVANFIPHQLRETPDLSITLLGFNASDEKVLTALANAYNIKTLKSVTKNTFAVVYEGDLDASRLESIKKHNPLLMDKNEFIHFVETGEIGQN